MSNDAPSIDVPAALRNAMVLLQEDPLRYRLFGVYWWPVKRLLRDAGYTTDNLYLLGGYEDAETAELVPDQDLESTLRAAFTEYGDNARFGRPDGRVESPDGDVVTIYDADAAR